MKEIRRQGVFKGEFAIAYLEWAKLEFSVTE
jgi:hypothetical protein